MTAESVIIELDHGGVVSGLWRRPEAARAALVLAHGAGTDMSHRSMAAISEGLAERCVATLRFNFPFTEKKSGRPDSPAVAQSVVRAAVAKAAALAPDLSLFAGGRSFGGRMTSLAQAAAPLGGVRGLVFFAFPLHPAGKPAIDRATHLKDVAAPMLFLQGGKDALADLALLQVVVETLGPRAALKLDGDADHSFHVAKKTGRSDDDVLAAFLDAARDFVVALSA